MKGPDNQSEIDEVLRKIGRNVLNFQRMESMLKFLISRSNLEGAAHELRANHEKAVDAVSRKTMGNLVRDLIASVYSEGEKDRKSKVEVQEPQFSFAFRVDSDPDYVEERKAALDRVVKERNALIHQMLVKFDQTSSKSRRELSEHLDAQAERMRPEYESLRSLILAFRAGNMEVLEAIENELLVDGNVKLNKGRV